MRAFRHAAIAVLFAAGCVQAREIGMGVVLTETGNVQVSVWGHGRIVPEAIELYRSTSRLDVVPPDTVELPVTVLRFHPDTGRISLVDSMPAHNVTYFYRALVKLDTGQVFWSEVDSVSMPDRDIGDITGSSLLVDKLHYFLEVRDGGRMRKRFPIALGPKPRERKLHFDRASTPEGVYEISDERPQASFYKAFDIDYPNGVDRARYAIAGETGMIRRSGGGYPSIGSGIQIHGQGIGGNWTFGCIALRNEDIDELFEHQRVGTGMPVIIVGSELSRKDIRSIRDYRTEDELRAVQLKLKRLGHYRKDADGIMGTGTRLALGRFQHANRIPVTCDFDARTTELLAETE
ncbi:MAG: L,D-transpeptidase family protein [candidate division WOR-3 bacterium]|nr:MAG: L,D-transpeptidase family protein [candidate division WOR-3 bacterium]